jgi:hypothetical protein
LVQRTSTLQGDTTLARLAFNSPVVSPDRFRTFRLKLFAAAGSHLTRCLLLRAGLLSGTACDDSDSFTLSISS